MGSLFLAKFNICFLKLLIVLLLNSEQVKICEAQVDKLYELDETLKLQLQGEINDLEHWIAQKEVGAGSEDIGQDLAQVEVLSLNRSC